ncbi:MAG: S41 family peptidase [Cyclobacteriaceae bacterium]|nr:S41 family peptidase [Cyclobacteriaceae bacterium]
MSEIKNTKQQIRLPLVLAIGIAAGILIGATFSEKKSSSGSEVFKSLQKFKEVLLHVDRMYVDEVNTDELVDNAIEHMLKELDPHTIYIPAKDKVRANEDLQGNFEGIGVEFNIFQDTIVVVTPLSGGPSEAVGVLSGDKIIKVDDKIVAGVGFTNRDVQDHLKGPKESEVKISVLRKGAVGLIDFTIIRDRIPQFSVDVSYMINDDIGYIKVSRFAATTYDEFKIAMNKLKEYGMKQLIIDLQGNPGGYMNHAINIADELLPDKKKIVYTKGKESKYDTDAFAERVGGFEEGEVIILVNEGSASASEILAGALQDNDRALVVGRRSFGKGLVQAPIDLSDGSELRLTISRYYTPSGRSIQKPYGKNNEDYAKDLSSRFSHGEFFHADSIDFNDSLKYSTSKGRTVYGGGGIMPDYFVPLDTAINSKYLNLLFYNNAIQEYTFTYAEEYKEELENMGYENYYLDFEVNDDMLFDLVKIGEKSGVSPDLQDLEMNKSLIQLHVKAQIARKIWDNEGFYPIFNQTNEILQQAVTLFGKAEELDQREY